ncbi:MAG TPA: hypothetical protein DCQ06_07615 [Myxococcales bacterium]|nr:hypothetical protein [Myxococcales bacterium]
MTSALSKALRVWPLAVLMVKSACSPKQSFSEDISSVLSDVLDSDSVELNEDTSGLIDGLAFDSASQLDTATVKDSLAHADVIGVAAAPMSPWLWSLGDDDVSVSWQDDAQSLRTWTITTSHALKDNEPASKTRTFKESAEGPRLRSGHPGLDAVYALALHETSLNSVEDLQDAAFNKGQPVPCSCFATGAKWPWVWTRDSAYAIALGLADLDLTRSKQTLLFKVAGRKAALGGGSPQIVQDTGTGGSWPVSSDRLVWTLGAAALHARLPACERNAFAKIAVEALHNTLSVDRKVTFESESGLYRGEQSFLDWREQSYPSWTQVNLTPIAESKALSTNVLYWFAHTWVGARSEQLGQSAQAAQHVGWAKDLRVAIFEHFKLTNTPLMPAMVGNSFDPSPTHRFELLGIALAIELGLTDATQSKAMLAAWPWSEFGPPVQWPQQPQTPIYHNRAIWPFVTAYSVLAGARAGHAETIWRGLRSIIELAALNLSHMENFEFLSGKNWVDDQAFSGPVVNSQRQLWSVAGAVGIIHQAIFGVHQRPGAFRVAPRVPTWLRSQWLPWGTSVALSGLNLQGSNASIVLHWPSSAAGNPGLFEVANLTVNGKSQALETWTQADILPSNAVIDVYLQWPAANSTAKLQIVPQDAPKSLWLAPTEPAAPSIVREQSKLIVSWPAVDGATNYDVWVNGKIKATGLTQTSWTSALQADSVPCFAIVAKKDKLHSHHSPGSCWWGDVAERIQTLSPYQVMGGVWQNGQTTHLRDIELLTQSPLRVHHLRPKYSGLHQLQLVYRNDSAGPSTGITSASARVVIKRNGDGQIVVDKRVVMAQNGDAFSTSTVLECELSAKHSYQLEVRAPTELSNMSELAHYASYNAGPGGGENPYMRFDLAAIKLLARQGPADPYQTMIKATGKDDLDKLGIANQVTPGLTLAPWGRVGLTWDDRFMWLSVVSKAFEQGLKPFILYLAPADGAPKPSTGMNYLNQSPKLAFVPKWAIGMRSQSDNNDGFGPWSGVFERVGDQWTQRLRFEPNESYWLATDKHTITVRVPRELIGAQGPMRITGHVVWALPGNEWKHTVPSDAAPWSTTGTSFFVIDPSQSPEVKGWVKK